MARRMAWMLFVGMTALGMLLSACGAPSTAESSPPTATASPGPTATPTAPAAPLSVYYGASHTIYALNAADGSVRWKHTVGNDVISVALADDVVYAATYDRKLTALRASDGSQLWQVATHYLISPFILVDGVIYTGSMASSSEHGFVDAFRASDGARLWEYDGGSCSFGEMAVDAAAVYLSPGGCQQSVFALRVSDSSVLWHSQLASIGGGVTVANGTLYVNNYGDLYALSASDGKQIWLDHLTVPSMGGFPAAVANGVVYVTTVTAIYALQTTNGAQLWTKPGHLAIGPVVDSSAVYFIPSGSTLDALKVSDGTTLWQVTKSGQFSTPASSNSILYVILGPGASGSTTYTVYAFHTSDGSIVWQRTASDGITTAVAVG